MGLLHAVIAPKKKIVQQKNGGSTPVQTSSLLLPIDYKHSRPNWKCKQASCAAMAISVLQFDSELEIKQASVTTFSCAPTGTIPPVNHTGGYWGSVSLGLKRARGRVSVFIMRCIYTFMQVKRKKNTGPVTHIACVLFLKCVIKSMGTNEISECINALYTAPLLRQNSFRSAKWTLMLGLDCWNSFLRT